MKKIKTAIIMLICTAVAAAGCSTADNTEPDVIEIPKLKIGVMPAADSAPIFIAEEKGYFKELGLDAEIQVYTNAANRQSALQSGELDGAMVDLIAFVNNVNNGFDIKITTSTDGSFPFLVNKDFTEKKNIKVGMMEISVTNFLSEEYLGDKYEIEKVYINEIPARLEMIKAGNLDMANIPEPMASMGELNGLKKIVYENKDDFMPEAMAFTGKALKEKEKAIELFHRAFDKAVDDINRDDTLAREVLIEKLQLKPEIKDKIILPVYHRTRLPDEAYIRKIVEWVERIQNIKVNVKYDDMIEGKYINQ
ncbi:MAG TPA: MetQ/NlpA family ABC transporter substrate-binding protein [Bacillota bacterium]|nr:MetQ/NlpA family ABC transporter substrate-binding protein [Bacillota bacterium]